MFPLHPADAAGHPVVNVPDNGPAKVHNMLHQPYPRVPRPAPLAVVAHHILVVGVGMPGEVALDENPDLLGGKPEEPVDLVQVRGVFVPDENKGTNV